MHKTSSDFRPNSHLRFIAELAEQGKTVSEAFDLLLPLVRDQIEPMIFTRNPKRELGEEHRVILPVPEQITKLRHAIGRVYGMLGRDTGDFRRGGSDSDSTTEIEITDSGIIIIEIDDEDGSTIEPDSDSSEEPEQKEEQKEERRPIQAAGKSRSRDELEKFIAALIRIREVLAIRRQSDSSTVEVANRPFEAGGNLIPRGFTADALLHTLALNWSPDLRQECGIPQTYDYLTLSAKLAEEFDVASEWNRVGNGKPIHPMLGMVRALADARQPIYLYGEAGTGKSYLAKQLATLMEVEYSETPMSLGASRGDLLGRHTASQKEEHSFIAAKFPERFSTGGVFNFEEFDASDPRMVIVLNNALSSNHFYNSMNGVDLEKHPDFIPVATANTLGMGADAKFNREKLDAATLDRWNMGRVEVKFDLEIALYLARNSSRPYNPSK